jgi:mycobactin peptide synthetase MbtE
VIPAPDEAGTPEAVVDWLTRRRISVVNVVPSVARSWLRHAGAPCPSVRTVFFAGEPLTGALVEQWHTTFPATRVRVNFYGTTETTLPKVYKRLRRIEATTGLLPVGKPVPGASVTLAESGEIVLVSRYSSHGYLGLPSARFTELADGETAYRTGDLGRLDDAGDLVVLGRGDDEVKVNGVRIHPAEVAASIRAGGEVHDVFVTGGPLTAYVVPARVPFDAAAVRRELMALVPPSMVPSVVVAVADLPRLPNGKVDREALRRTDGVPPAAPPVEPSGELEHWVAGQWRELLGTADGDFFGCGGDSITAMRLAARIRRDFGVTLSVRAVFANATVALLAQEIADRQLAGMDPAELLELFAQVERA